MEERMRFTSQEEQGAILVEAINNAISSGRIPKDGIFIKIDKDHRVEAVATMTDAAHERMLKNVGYWENRLSLDLMSKYVNKFNK